MFSRYAINAVLSQRQPKRKSYNWSKLQKRINDKTVYIELWKRKLNTPPNVMGVINTAASMKKKELKKAKLNKKLLDNYSQKDDADNRQQNDQIFDYKNSPLYLSILDENITMKNERTNIINDASKLSIMSLRERGLRTFSGISPARYRSAKDSQEFPLSPMPFNASINSSIFASSSSSFTSPIRYDKNGNYINNKNNNDDDIRQSSNYNNYNNYNNYINNDYDNIEKESLTVSSLLLLKNIEEHSSFDDVIYFRSLAERDLEFHTDGGHHQSWLFKFMAWCVLSYKLSFVDILIFFMFTWYQVISF